MKWFNSRNPGVRYREHPDRMFKRRKDRYIVIRYRRDGELRSERLGWESEGATIEEAVRLRGEILSNIRKGEGVHSLGERREKEKARRDGIAREKLRKEKENVPFSILAEKYIAFLKQERKSWKPDNSRYEKHIAPEFGATAIKDVDRFAVGRLKRNLQKKGLSPKSVCHVLTLVRAMINKAPLWRLPSAENPVTEASKLDDKFLEVPDNNRTRYLTKEEARSLLDTLVIKSQDVHDMAFLALFTGMRAGEILKLQWRDVNFKSGLISIRDAKNAESRTANITPVVEKMLLQREPREIHHFIFTDRDDNQVSEVSNTFERTVAELGFNEGVEDRRDKVVFHSLRHTFGSWLAQDGVPLQVISDLMGHRDLKMTRRYAKLSPGQKLDAVLNLASGW